MFGCIERLIAARYLRFSHKEGFVAVIAWFSFLGILLGVGTLIVVMSVMNGFKHELMNRILGLNGHLTVYTYQSGISDDPLLKKNISHISGVQSVFPLIEKQGLFITQNGASGGMIHAMNAQDLQKKKLIAENLTEGSIQDLSQPNTLLIGYKLARRLNLRVGDKLKIMAAESQPTAFGFFPKTRYFRIIGLFNSGMHEYDQGFVFMPLASAQDFFELPQKITGLEIFVDNPEVIEKVKQDIVRFLPQYAGIYDWQQANLHFFNAIKVQSNVMFFILTLIVLVAVFNIISCLVMLVKDKTRDIAILNTMGATRSMILKTFVLIGSSIGVTGTLAGSVLGLAFSYNIDRIKNFLETLTGVELFEAEIYFLAHLPSKVSLSQVALVIATSLMLSFLATLYPAWKASRLNPIKGLRYA